jgi:hypothetical protein
MSWASRALGSVIAVGLAVCCLAGCSESLDPKFASIATEFADSKLDVTGSEIVDWRKGVECLVVEVRTPDDELYRVVMTANGDPGKPYTPWGVSQLYTLDDFVASSDVGCGVYNTNAWEENSNGRAVIVR